MARKMVERELPVGVEVAAHRFAAACKHDGVEGLVDLYCYGGKVEYMYCDERMFVLIDGKWYERKEVDDGR